MYIVEADDGSSLLLSRKKSETELGGGHIPNITIECLLILLGSDCWYV